MEPNFAAKLISDADDIGVIQKEDCSGCTHFGYNCM